MGKRETGNRKKAMRKASGQVVTEYVIMLVAILLITLCVLGFSYIFNIYGGRMADSVSIEYP